MLKPKVIVIEQPEIKLWGCICYFKIVTTEKVYVFYWNNDMFQLSKQNKTTKNNLLYFRYKLYSKQSNLWMINK